MAKQIQFKDLENNEIHGGIELDDGNVVCACCGGLFEKEEKGETWEKVKSFKTWVNLDAEICGSD